MDPLVKFVIVIHLLLSSHSSQTRSVANQGNHFIVYLFFSFLSGFFSICSFVLSQYPPSLTFICVPVWFMPCRFICCVQDVALMFLFPPISTLSLYFCFHQTTQTAPTTCRTIADFFDPKVVHQQNVTHGRASFRLWKRRGSEVIPKAICDAAQVSLAVLKVRQ